MLLMHMLPTPFTSDHIMVQRILSLMAYSERSKSVHLMLFLSINETRLDM